MINAILLFLMGMIALGFEVIWLRERDKRKASERECKKLRAALEETERDKAWWCHEAFKSLELLELAEKAITVGTKGKET